MDITCSPTEQQDDTFSIYLLGLSSSSDAFLSYTRYSISLPVCRVLREKCPYSEFFCYVFSRIRTEYAEILRISLYSVQMRENKDQKNIEYGHFPRNGVLSCSNLSISIAILFYSDILNSL